MTKMSAKTFRNPLIRTLALLSGYQGETPVAMKATYPLVIKALGIPHVMTHGTNGATGIPQVEKWIQWANKALIREGLAKNQGRGKWSLTFAGIQEARALGISATNSSSPPSLAPQTPVVHLAAVKGVSVSVGGRTLGSYHTSAYIRSLAIEKTGCFGSYTNHKGAICATCPLAGPCQNYLASRYSNLAKRLALQETQNSKAPAPTPATKPAPKQTAPKKTAPAQRSLLHTSKLDFSGADPIKVRAESLCGACGLTIGKGESALWLEAVDDSDDGALFHPACGGR